LHSVAIKVALKLFNLLFIYYEESIMRIIRHQLGQGMTEYIIIVAMIAVAAIATYQFFGKTVRNQTAAIANEIAGNDGTTAKTAAQTAATDAATKANTKETLDSYTNNIGE
jgi:type IV pilus assembly protein PilA